MYRAVPLDRFEGLPDMTSGLAAGDAETRAAHYGQNLILETPRRGWLSLLREAARDPMLWFLLVTSALFAIVDQWTESAVLLAALVPFLGMDAYLNRRTRASIEGLSSRLATLAMVERGGRREVIASIELVPGDLVVLGPGDAIPADGLFVRGERMQADESALSGEAFPVRKKALPKFPRNQSEAKVGTAHWGFAGTRLLAGEGLLRIAYTGAETWYGEIIRSATLGTRSQTPLQQAVAHLVAVLSVGAGFVCIVIAWVRYQQGHGLLDALLSAVTLAVAALPEEFPVVLTFFLGVGVYRLAKKQALVRRSVVVENIGRVSCICTDKTGTITEGRLQLAHRVSADGISDGRLLQLAAAPSRRESGDPIDVAILDSLDTRPLPWSLEESFPFTEDRKRETGIVREDGRLLAAVKGAPEIVLSQCDLTSGQRAWWLRQVEELARTGHKVIACAWRELEPASWSGGEPDRNFRIAGLLCFEDPVRPGVRDALQACRNARIRVVMVTGDHPSTASAVAREVGLGADEPRIIEGDAMAACLARGDTSSLRNVDVIARAVPAHKLELVRALQASGEIVAVTGDGVNDVPALLASDVGIAMGEHGTRSAREVAAIVLLDDNFRTIVGAIAEGRQLFANLQLSFQYLLMIHFPLVVTAALIPLAGYPLLYLPIHVVWLELIIHPTALLAFQDTSRHGLSPAPRNARVSFFSRRQWLTMAAGGAVITVMVAATYVRSLGIGHDVEHARAMAMVVLTTASAGITASLAPLRSRATQVAVAGTIAFSFVLVQTPPIAALLHLKPLHTDDWLLAMGGGLLASLLAAAASARRAGRQREACGVAAS